MEYDEDEPGAPAFLAFELWDLRADELNPDYWQTGYIREIQPIKNGFIAITSNDKNGSTTYTFKKTKVNPIAKLEQKKLRKRIADIEAGTTHLQEHELIEE